MESLVARSLELGKSVPTDFVRGLMVQINWKNRLIGIRGARGVGKTTLLLQRIKLHHQLNREAVFLNLDDLWFTENRLIDFAEDFVNRGGKFLYLDEVHRYPGWSVEVKNIYDYFPELKIVFTGSSVTRILNSRADLSRRAVVYEMQGLSFREFLNFSQKTDFQEITLSEILENHEKICVEINSRIKPLAYFDTYLKSGYFPYFMEGKEDYHFKLGQTIKLSLEVDLLSEEGYQIKNIHKIRKLLYVIATSVPFKPNIAKLSERIGLNRNTLINYIYYLENAKLLSLLHHSSKGIPYLQKPDKIYPENTNMLFSIAPGNVEKGTVRETFFLNQIAYHHRVNYPNSGDFLVDDQFHFEIGGKNKNRTQIARIPKSYVAADDMAVGFDTKIPLWLFGFLY